MAIYRQMAPQGAEIVEYDRMNLALYAALLDAADAGLCWRKAAASLLQLDPDALDSEACWRSHLERARWITDQGLGSAIRAFGRSDRSSPSN